MLARTSNASYEVLRCTSGTVELDSLLGCKCYAGICLIASCNIARRSQIIPLFMLRMVQKAISDSAISPPGVCPGFDAQQV